VIQPDGMAGVAADDVLAFAQLETLLAPLQPALAVAGL
jgi:hypothetical protein